MAAARYTSSPPNDSLTQMSQFYPPPGHAQTPITPLTVGATPPSVANREIMSILELGNERNETAKRTLVPHTSEALAELERESELTFLQLGSLAETFNDPEKAVKAYEGALRHNPASQSALTRIANIFRSRDNFKAATDYYGRLLAVSPQNGDAWASVGHCYLMIDDLKRAYHSYQQALYYMPNPHPKLWYGIGILYDRYSALDNAEEAFSNVVALDSNFEKASEVFFRLGIIYKQQRKASQALDCFRHILTKPPAPLTAVDIWFQIGHVHELQNDLVAAKEAYERVLAENPNHAKVLQQLGGMYHRPEAPFFNPEMSIGILTKSLGSNHEEAFSWYLLGRAYMSMRDHGKAYEAYQQAVYREGRNPAFWCSIGVLYYNISQFHDALDAYSRAIRIYPFIAEVWFNLGSLYEACNDQMEDAIDAYERVSRLDEKCVAAKHRLAEIHEHQNSGARLSSPPPPMDISPTSASWIYATTPITSAMGPSAADARFGHTEIPTLPPDAFPTDARRRSSGQHSAHPSQDSPRLAAVMHRTMDRPISPRSVDNAHHPPILREFRAHREDEMEWSQRRGSVQPVNGRQFPLVPFDGNGRPQEPRPQDSRPPDARSDVRSQEIDGYARYGNTGKPFTNSQRFDPTHQMEMNTPRPSIVEKNVQPQTSSFSLAHLSNASAPPTKGKGRAKEGAKKEPTRRKHKDPDATPTPKRKATARGEGKRRGAGRAASGRHTSASPALSPVQAPPIVAESGASSLNSREVDEDYDDGVDALMGLASGIPISNNPLLAAAAAAAAAVGSPTPPKTRSRSITPRNDAQVDEHTLKREPTDMDID